MCQPRTALPLDEDSDGSGEDDERARRALERRLLDDGSPPAWIK
jgi:hypothetical protein